ncbi:MAG: CocE/NonD family hydrolase [Anaerolineales bacterium]|nr:CocE/NonD family hydrolase [Anaerolineales bacterium]
MPKYFTSHAQSCYHSPMTQYALFKNIMIPMRDGVRLASDIYRPVDKHGELVTDPLPVILVRTSYNKEGLWLTDEVVDGFVPYGYVLVLQDLRGRHQSEGMGQYFHVVNPTAGLDGYDTIEWLAAQPWCNGRVGMAGSSHLGLVQTHAALYRPPHLAAIWPDVSPTNSYAHQVRWGGAMQLHMFGALFLHAHDAQELRDDPEGAAYLHREMERLRTWIDRTPFRLGETPLRVVPHLEQTAVDYYTRGSYDDYWAQEANDFTAQFHRHADIPGTYSSGWYDPYAIAVTDYYAQMSQQNKSPQRLVMGPWTHGGLRGGLTYALDVDFGAASAWGFDRYNQERRRWFDRWLKGAETGVEEEPPVQLFVMGGGSGRKTVAGKLDHGGHWRSEWEWPLTRTRYTPFYLQPGGGLGEERPLTTSHLSYQADPDHPVPTVAGTVTGFFELLPLGELAEGISVQHIPLRARMRSLVPDGAAHQQEAAGMVGAKPPYPRLADRPDVLVFQTPPLTQAVEVTGPITVHLWVASSALDTDFTAKLLDVYPPNEDYPDGYEMNLVDGIIRARYRLGFTEEQLLTPGEITAVSITLPPTSNLFAPGHRVRLDIASSNFPRFDINPNTGEPMGRHTHTVIAHNTVYFGAGYPSCVVLPLVSSG